MLRTYVPGYPLPHMSFLVAVGGLDWHAIPYWTHSHLPLINLYTTVP